MATNENNFQNKKNKIPRRDILKGALASAGATTALSLLNSQQAKGAEAAPRKPDLIKKENQKEGALEWQLTRIRLDKNGGIRTPWIEGYCNKQSVTAGEQLEIMVSCNPPEKFVIEIFRTGYYGGRGARLMTKLGPFDGKKQVTPTSNGERQLHECKWKPTTTITIPDDWASGVYLGRLTTLSDTSGHGYWQSYVVFIVTDDRPADILLQCSDNTWQAYNKWPSNYSIYTHPKGNQGPWADVSFDRPYGKYSQIYEEPLSVGSGEWLCFEFPMAYWLEKHGYDVTYCSNSDMLTPQRGLKCKTFLSVGHDEYWDIRQYKSVVKMRDEGVSLMFFSGNAICWVSPFEKSSDGRDNRLISRGGPYGGQHKWAKKRHELHGPFPHSGPDEGYLMGGRNVKPENGGGDWFCTNAKHWIFNETGMKNGDSIPGLVGWECHGDAPKDIPGIEVVANGTFLQGGVNPQQWEATIYPGPKGNIIFNAATIFWCQGLSSPPGHMIPWSHWSRPHGPDHRVQQMTHNLLKRAIG